MPQRISNKKTLAAAYEQDRLWASTVDPDLAAEYVALGEAFVAGYETALRAAGDGELSLHDEMVVGVGRRFLEGVAERTQRAATDESVAA